MDIAKRCPYKLGRTIWFCNTLLFGIIYMIGKTFIGFG